MPFFSLHSKIVFSLLIAAGCVSSLGAWTIRVLDLEATNKQSNQYRQIDVIDGQGMTQFKAYLEAAGSTLEGGNLADYQSYRDAGTADAVIVNLPMGLSTGAGYSAAEIQVLQELMQSDVRVFLIGENSSWDATNQQICEELWGLDSYVTGNGKTRDSAGFVAEESVSELMSGISKPIYLYEPGFVDFAGGGGQGEVLIGVDTKKDVVILGGENDNFLWTLDMNIVEGLQDGHPNYHNYVFAQNLAKWLGAPIPEPSTYALGVGALALGCVLLRRRQQTRR